MTNDGENPQAQFASLLGQLKSPDENVRKEACKSLGKLATSGESYVIRPLIRLLEHQDYLVRFNACEALGTTGEPRATRPLINRLKDEEEWVRESACRALGNVGDVRAIGPLIERLDDSFEKVRDAAFRSLVKFGEGRIAKAIKENSMRDLLRIARFGDPRPVDKIIEIIKHKVTDPQIQTELKKQLLGVHGVYKKNSGKLFCSECFHRFSEHDTGLKLGLKKRVPYYSCRNCNKTIYAKHGISEVTAVIDSERDKEVAFDSSKFIINYLSFNKLFDFNKVEIIRTSDKVIEQFCYKISKDDDPVRKQNYKRLKCLISPNSTISIHSKSMLKTVFPKVITPR